MKLDRQKILHLCSKVPAFLMENWPRVSFFLKKNGAWIFTFLIVIMLADLTLILFANLGSPSISKTSSRIRPFTPQPKKESSFIHHVNIFHNGDIPPSLKEKNSASQAQKALATPTKSSLSLKLLGTLESVDPSQSIATIHSSYGSKKKSFFIGDEIDHKARITQIERRKVTFINLETSQLEYIEIPKVATLIEFNRNPSKPSLNVIPKKTSTESKWQSTRQEGILKKGNQFLLDRSSINQLIKNLPDILQQARVDPEYKNGKVLGYKFTWIDPESLFNDLGFKKGDTILSVDGKKVVDQVQALKIFHELKNSSQVGIQIQRDGTNQDINYTVNEDASNLSHKATL